VTASLVNMDLLKHITTEPGKCGARPCLRGLRIRVSDVLGMLVAGETADTILKDFPDLEADDIRAALVFAATQSNY